MLYIETFTEVAFLLIAQTKNQKLILADNTLEKTKPYFCPSCQHPVHLISGSVIRPHFAHFQNDACEVFAEGETIEHIDGKMQLAKWLKDQGLKVEIEAYLPQLQQRPDLLVSVDHQQIAIEFQCSPIAIEKVVERTEGYLNAGYQVVWILGRKFTYKNNLTAFQKACLSEIRESLKLFHYHTEKQQLTVRSQFQLNQKEKMTCQKQVIQNDNAIIFKESSRRKQLTQTTNIHKRHQQLIRMRSDKKNTFQQFLYQNNENLVSIPREIYTVLPSEWMIQDLSYLWKFNFLLWLEQFPNKKIITKKWLLKNINQTSFYAMPQITEDQQLQPVYELLEILNQSNVVKKIGENKWSFQKKAQRYKYLEEKFSEISR